jgi:eukaryotic-like serine/threonine-protein kinase
MFPQIFGKYVLEREIAAGGMARVFLATLRGAGGFEKRLVVKQIRPELASDQAFVGRFVDEAKTTVELSHSNIVPVYELGVEQGTYYIAMEYCEGVSLTQLLATGPLSPAEGAYVGVEVCRALDYAHRKTGIIHRDVTPRNVMVDPEGMVRLIDFVIAASADADGTGQDALFGSPGHMPPEQLQRGPLTPAADVFAVGALLVEAWTGRPPFRRASFEASRAALKEPVPPLADADARLAPLAALIESALAHEPRERPQTAEELARPLREFLRQSDLGDIARRLGERVSERRSLRPEPGSASPTPARAPELAGVTQTFAVRDAVLEWTAKIDTQPNRVSRAPAADGVPNGSEVMPPSSSALSYRAPRAPLPSGRAWLRWGAAALALAVIAAQWVLQASSVAGVAEAGTTVPASAPAGLPTPSLDVSSVPAPTVVNAIAPPSQSPVTLAPVVRTKTAVNPPPREKAAAAARVNLTAEPPALVKVDGASVGRTPLLGLSLPPGRHVLSFSNESLGEKLETRIELDADEHQRVHADFTSATPQLYVR